jgi:gamma-glutamyltranspeptidase
MGKLGMVSSAHPLASLAGLKMLVKGGNAIDAIVATAAALSVLEPHASGLGGVGFMLLYSAKENRVRALPFGGRSPAAARLELVDREATTTGPKAPLVMNLLEFGMNIQDAIGAPRFRWNDDVDAKLPAESVAMETRVSAEVIKALQARGYNIELVGDWSTRVGGAQGVVIDRATGWLRGGADPRRGGYALGW